MHAPPSRELVLAPLAGKFAAVAVVICAVLHVPLLLMHRTDSIVLTVLMGIAAAACLTCVPHLVRRPTYRTWASCGLLSGTMLALHLALVLTDAAPAGDHSAEHVVLSAPVRTGHTDHVSAWDAGLLGAATATAVLLVLLAAIIVRRAGRAAASPTHSEQTSKGSWSP
jgi:hypothetical protein